MQPHPRAVTALPPLREMLARHGIQPKKSLGQHFLFDLNLTTRIARAAGNLSQGTTIEVGPGPGGLTRALLDLGARRVVAVERDARMMPLQAEIAAAYPGRLEVVCADALAIDLALLGETPRRICANLPYNVGVPLLLRWLKQIHSFESVVVMLQKEVVDRLCAQPDGKSYGRLSVLTQWLCRVEPLFDVSPRAFIPPPQVVSGVVRLAPRPAPLAEASFSALERVVAAAFGQRRKMLRQSLKPLIAALPKGQTPESVCAAAGIDPTCRAENLDVAAFCALARLLDNGNAAQHPSSCRRLGTTAR